MFQHLAERAIDDDMNFWPVRAWQPDRHEDISSDLCFKVAAVQTLVVTSAATLLALAFGRDVLHRFVSSAAMIAVLLFCGIYGLLRLVLMRAWNRRAARLR